ncbi:hypothetical protein EYF80_054826 [Liparis tanakae]|uniref:Uncharacterized protein n=1 Tax=Liparis tanakae TaxID=230148 RepID=A0A4Z2F218_9TELE|nr:hypothetical protein EYF80_054826 [Liparis tanakae]
MTAGLPPLRGGRRSNPVGPDSDVSPLQTQRRCSMLFVRVEVKGGVRIRDWRRLSVCPNSRDDASVGAGAYEQVVIKR